MSDISERFKRIKLSEIEVPKKLQIYDSFPKYLNDINKENLENALDLIRKTKQYEYNYFSHTIRKFINYKPYKYKYYVKLLTQLRLRKKARLDFRGVSQTDYSTIILMEESFMEKDDTLIKNSLKFLGFASVKSLYKALDEMYEENTVEYYVEHDMINKLKEIDEDNLKTLLHKNKFRTFYRKEVNLLSVAAYYNSYNCFEYLNSLSPELCDDIIDELKLFIFINGYNKVFTNKIAVLDEKSVFMLIEFNRFELFDELIERISFDINDERVFRMSCKSTIHLSIRFLLMGKELDFFSIFSEKIDYSAVESLKYVKMFMKIFDEYKPISLIYYFIENKVRLLHFTCKHPYYISFTDTLLKIFKLDFTELDKQKKSPLQIALECKNIETSKLLIDQYSEYNIPIDIKLFNIACRRNLFEIVAIILELGYDPNVKDIFGKTPLHLAAKHASYDVISLLIKYKADVNIQSNTNKTPIFYTCSRNLTGYGVHGNTCSKIIQLLYDNGSNINVCTKLNVYPLHYACRKCNFQAIIKLLELGAHPNVYDFAGYTPLFILARNSTSEIFQKINEVAKIMIEKYHAEDKIPCGRSAWYEANQQKNHNFPRDS